MPHFHAVVFIDHKEALVLEFGGGDVTEHCVKASDRHGNVHHKAGSTGSGHAHDSKAYLTAVVDLLKPSHEILIVGHGNGKDELARFIREHAPVLAPRIMGVKSMDQPSKGEILAFAPEFLRRQGPDHAATRHLIRRVAKHHRAEIIVFPTANC